MSRRTSSAVLAIGVALLPSCGSSGDGGGGGAATGGSAGATGGSAGAGATGGAATGGSAGAGATGGAATGGSAGAGATGGAGTGGGAGAGATGGSAGAGATGGSAGAGATGGSAGAAGGGGGSAGGGGVTGTEIDFDPAALPQSDTTFPAGIQAGDATASSVMLWTLHAGTELVARVYAATAPGKAIVLHESSPVPSPEGYVHVDVTGLPALTELEYVFLERAAGDFVARSPIGRFVTAPAAGTRPRVRFGGTSCTSNGRAPFEALQRGGEQRLDFFLLAGDTTYNDSAETLAEYRSEWTAQIGEGTYQELLQSTAHYATWDDHEVDNDWNPETISSSRKAAAFQTFFEHLPIRRDPVAPDRIWRSYTWGDTLEIFVLDSRGERKPSTRNGPAAEYLSQAQYDWLVGSLAASTATFKIILNSVPISNFPGLFDFASGDRWEGYPSQRAKLLDFIVDTGITGVLFLSGDFHLASVQRVEPSGKWGGLLEALMGPGDQSSNPLWSTLPSPQFEFRSGTSNVTVFDADPNANPPTIRIEYLAGNGSSLFAKTYSF
ncbi:MAG: alkaline phosphatase D family protein [Polyangiaceae bacterium]|nr:alkaline phosphatase D family protein [Polyangiaceae bacterium]